MENTLTNLIIFGSLEHNTIFVFKNNSTMYRYVSYSLDNLSNGDQKSLVMVYNLNKNKYEVLDCSIGTKLYKKEVVIL